MEYTQFINGHLLMHMNMGKSSVRTDSWQIVAPSHILHGQHIIRQVDTAKVKGVWQKGVVRFFHREGPKLSPEFKTIEEFIAHYNLPPLKPKEVNA